MSRRDWRPFYAYLLPYALQGPDPVMHDLLPAGTYGRTRCGREAHDMILVKRTSVVARECRHCARKR